MNESSDNENPLQRAFSLFVNTDSVYGYDQEWNQHPSKSVPVQVRVMMTSSGAYITNGSSGGVDRGAISRGSKSPSRKDQSHFWG